MPALPAGDQTAVSGQWMAYMSSNGFPMPGVLKANVATTITAIDTFLDTNPTAGAEVALPQLGNNEVTATMNDLFHTNLRALDPMHKSRLAAMVYMKRVAGGLSV